MWKKPWTMKEGAAIGAAILSAGVLLQLGTGPVLWEAFAWPVNALVLAIFLLAATVVFLVRRNSYFIHFLTTHRAAVPALGYAGALTILMGLTRQEAEGRWLHGMLTFWPFVLAYAYICFLLCLLTLRRISHMVRFHHRHPKGGRRPWLRDIGFILNHGGLCITLLCATLGSADMHRLRMTVTTEEAEWRAVDELQRVVQLPFGIQLQRFILEQYPDGSPRRYASDLIISRKNRQQQSATVDVNHPVSLAGWKIYQFGYDTAAGAESKVSVLELVSDPWLPYVYTGIFMLLGGALLMCFDRSYSTSGVSEEEIRREREKRRQKEQSRRRLRKEFHGEGSHHHHGSNDDRHYHAET